LLALQNGIAIFLVIQNKVAQTNPWNSNSIWLKFCLEYCSIGT